MKLFWHKQKEDGGAEVWGRVGGGVGGMLGRVGGGGVGCSGRAPFTLNPKPETQIPQWSGPLHPKL